MRYATLCAAMVAAALMAGCDAMVRPSHEIAWESFLRACSGEQVQFEIRQVDGGRVFVAGCSTQRRQAM